MTKYAGLDEYEFRQLLSHLIELEKWPYVKKILTDFEFLYDKVNRNLPYDIIRDYQQAHSCCLKSPGTDGTKYQTLLEFENAFSQEIHTFIEHPHLTIQQLYNNLYAHHGCNDEVSAILNDFVTHNQYPSETVWLRRLNTSPHTSRPKALLRTMIKHMAPVICVSISPSDTMIASGGLDGMLCFWQYGDGALMKSFPAHQDGVTAITWLTHEPGDTRIVSAGNDQLIKIWDWKTGQEMNRWRAHTDNIRSLTGFDDGKQIVSAGDDRVLIGWEAETGRELWRLHGHLDRVFCLASEFTSKTLISGSEDRTLRVWDPENQCGIRTLRGHTALIRSLALDPSGQLAVSGSDDQTVKIWDLTTDHQVNSLKSHRQRINCVALGPDFQPSNPSDRPLALSFQMIVSGSDDETIKIWDAKSGELRQTLRGHSGSVNTIAISSNGRWFTSGGEDGTVRIWDTSLTTNYSDAWREHEAKINCLAINSSGKSIASGSMDNTIRLWDSETGIHQLNLRGHLGPITCLAFLNNQFLASGSEDRRIRIWDVATGKMLKVLGNEFGGFDDSTNAPIPVDKMSGHEQAVTCLATWNQAGYLISGSKDRTLRLWNIKTGKVERVFSGLRGAVESIIVAPDQNAVISGAGRDVILWDFTTTQPIAKFQLASLTCLSLTKRNRLISGSRDGTIRVCDLDKKQEIRCLQAHDQGIRCFATDSSGECFVSGGHDRTVKVWDTQTGRNIHTFSNHSKPIRAVAVDSETRRVFSGAEDERFIIWDLDTGKMIGTTNLGSIITCILLMGANRICLGTEHGSIVMLQLESH